MFKRKRFIRFKPKTAPKACYLCEKGIEVVDYKDTAMVKRFVSPYGKIMSRERTGTCAKHQRVVSQAIKRARYIGLFPFFVK